MAIWPFAKKRRTNDAGTREDPSSSDELRAADVRYKKQRMVARDETPPQRGRGTGDPGQVGAAATSEKDPKSGPRPNPGSVPNVDKVLADGAGRDPALGIFSENRGAVPSYYFQHAASHTTLSLEQRNSWQRPPTLRHRPTGSEASHGRRRSAKVDPVRESQIRNMSDPTTVLDRPATNSGSGLLQRDSKRMRSALNRSFTRPMSEISLPIPESVESSTTALSEQNGFRVRAFDLLSPRPTIRYATRGHYTARLDSAEPSRANSRREKRAFVSEESLGNRKRIDELADDLDASAIRELMERDQRRKDKKRKADDERLRRKLQERAEKQRREEAEAERASEGKKAQRGGPGRDALGISADPTAAARGERQLARSLDEREGMLIQPSWLHDPSAEHLAIDPAAANEVAGGGVSRDATPIEDLEEPEIGTAKAVRLSQASMSPPVSPQYQPTLQVGAAPVQEVSRESTAELSEPSEWDARASTSSGRQAGAGSWTSLFRRSGTKTKHSSSERGRLTPSEFSNTSRDSLSRQFPAVPGQVGFQRRSNPIVRTKSKFREDLPELPLSPPDSRVQSVEPVPPSPARGEAPAQEPASSSLAERISVGAGSPTTYDPFADPSLKARNETSLSNHRSSEAPSLDGRAPSTVVSQSMASIDSEGSWLSGGRGKRGSQGPQPVRNSAGSLQRRFHDYSDSGEELGVAEDEYFSRLTPGPEVQGAGHDDGQGRRRSSVAIASTDGEDEADTPAAEREAMEEKAHHGTVGRKPTVVHRQPHVRSREGLLNDFQAGDEPLAGEGSLEDVNDENSKVQHGVAHARHMSAGSAKLLDIKTKPHGEHRLSGGSAPPESQADS
ncbi:MAG: hypothetical protein M1832_005324 [Thelocarpon impressellum]|nr:MAG: hypothetical protein M1832_005324 [Thelocarpon impressellum]